MPKISLESGFVFDYTNLYGTNKVTSQDLEEIEHQILQAHEAIERIRHTQTAPGHVSKDGEPEWVRFMELPYVATNHINSPLLLKRLQEFGEHHRNSTDAIISLWIGGSYLGSKVLFDCFCGNFWNESSAQKRNGYPKMYFSGNNLDGNSIAELVTHRKAQAENKNPYKILLLVVSKSGSTLETMGALLYLYAELSKISHVQVEVAAVTDCQTGSKETLLHKLAKKEKWEIFCVPEGVSGRFSIFSEVGLVIGACLGIDIHAFLEGAKNMDMRCQENDLFSNIALLNASLKYIAGEKYGKNIEVCMPYADALKSVAEWYVQLLAESLGKRIKTEAEKNYGRTPVPALWTTDMHAQTQEHQEGRYNKIIQFIQIEKWKHDPQIKNIFPEFVELEKISQIRFSQWLHAAQESNAQALAQEGRLNATFSLPELTPYHLGELLYLFMLSIAYEAELAKVNAFDQPWVEAYKKILGPKITQLQRKKS